MKKAIAPIIVALIATQFSMAASPKKWTLSECIDYAMANNITLKQSRLTVRSANEDIKKSK